MHEGSSRGYAYSMNWTYWLAGAIALAFIASILIFAAMRDRGRGKEVVSDLPARTAPDPAADPHEPRARG
ncbi:hypothetical protein GCM10011584_33500 [Nocardioides phosphati]|uniref:Uncharacterized protein n=2 Tax=Nocardioides phosphati TaxID=1867775 RepID=A0ABQ2NFR5_9ACTN|nr:hypothetical protein GCM10011584_33500 [Nocardioides phosphati]